MRTGCRDGDGMPGWGAAQLPLSLGHMLHPGPAASSDPLHGAGRAVGWHYPFLHRRRALGCTPQALAHVCACGDHHGTARRQQCRAMCLGTGTSRSPATPSPNSGTEQRVAPGALACREPAGGCCGLGESPRVQAGPVRGVRARGVLPAHPHAAPGGGRLVSRPAAAAGTFLPCPGHGVVGSGDSVWTRGPSP